MGRSNLTSAARRAKLSYCPYCASELIEVGHSFVDIGDQPELIESATCQKCGLTFRQDIGGDISETGIIHKADFIILEVNLASDKELEICQLSNQDNEVDLLKNHRTPREDEDYA